MELEISGLNVYPIKSLGGIALKKAELTNTGFAYDRYWMLVDENGKFITQREVPDLARFKLRFSSKGLIVEYEESGIEVPFVQKHNDKRLISVEIWKEELVAQKEEAEVNDWFSQRIGRKVFLVRFSSKENRYVKRHPEAQINFPDGGQYLLLGESSLDNLNKQLDEVISIDRFRANIIFKGGGAHLEDEWESIEIGSCLFEVTKSCARCKIITINQKTGEVGKEPLQTLSKYRLFENKIWFGRFFKWQGNEGSEISIGNKIRIRK